MASDQRLETVGQALRGVFRDRSWPKKLGTAALINLIPYFGAVWVMGYALHYQRALAWGAEDRLPNWRPMEPQLRTGFYAFVAAMMYSLVPSFALGMSLSLAITLPDILGAADTMGDAYYLLVAAIVVVMTLLLFAVTVVIFPVYVHVNMYDRLDAGFQAGRIFGLVRENGKLFATAGRRTFGMMLLVSTVTFGTIFAVIAAGIGLSIALLPDGWAPQVYILMVLPLELLGVLLANFLVMPFSLAMYRLWAGYARVAYGLADLADAPAGLPVQPVAEGA